MAIYSETALDWWQRSEKNHHHHHHHHHHRRRRRRRLGTTIPATDPISAAWTFLEGNTGIAYIDAAWQQNPEAILVIEGSVAKTWTLRSLAARWVVATRPSRFCTKNNKTPNDDSSRETSTTSSSTMVPSFPTMTPPPQVLVLDSNQDFATSNAPILSHVVRSTLLRQSSYSSTTTTSFEEELQQCMERIHVCATDQDDAAAAGGGGGGGGWIAILEVLRQELSQPPFVVEASTAGGPNANQEENIIPTLLLWDGCPAASSTITTTTNTTGKEILQQLVRLLDACPHVYLVLTTSTSTTTTTTTTTIQTATNMWMNALTNINTSAMGHYDPPRRQLQRIQLERRFGKDCVANVLSTAFAPTQAPFSFSLSLGGILS